MPVKLQDIQSLIEHHNAGWIAGDNPHSRLSREERVRLLGAMEPRPAIPFRGHVHYHTGTGLPASFDYRNIDGKNYVTSIRNQGKNGKNCGSCVAFACVGAIEATISRQQSHNNPTIHLSEAQLFFCYGHQDGANCATPWWPEKALPYCVHQGLVDDGCFPYTPHDQPCNLCADWQNRLTKIKTFAQLGSQAAIKDWLVNRGAVVVLMDVYEDFFWYISGVYKHVTGDQIIQKHCMACIGYDDGAGCWICKNSWGPDMGELGFYRIGYGQCRIDSWDVFGVE
jgi:C1A family cysteine protease